MSDRHRPFLSCAPPDVTLCVRHGPAPYTELGNPVFDSGGNWTLHHVQGQPVIRVRALGLDPYQIVVLEPDLQRGDIYCVGDVWARDDGPQSALGYPLEEVLAINLLARGRGVLLHACGVCDDGRGMLFAGTSGAGKSTMASLWEEREGVTVLSDDRVIVREREGRFWAYGTPWHGDARVLSPEAAPLEQIFLIQHANEHCPIPLKPVDAALLKKCAEETGAIVTAEEHSIVGGLGSAVAEVLAGEVLVPVKMVGIADTFTETSKDFDSLLDKYGMAVDDIVRAAQQAVKRK